MKRTNKINGSGNMMSNKKILLICGSLNQTTMMYKISQELPEFDCYFTPYYGDGIIDLFARTGMLDWTLVGPGGKFQQSTLNFLREHDLKIDYYGLSHDYDLVITCSDIIIPKNIRNKKIILVQEGMTDPKKIGFYLVKWLNLPLYVAGDTSVFGLSDAFDYLCVASEGYKELFIENGVDPQKIVVTGIPNFDNCEQYRNNNFPHKNFVLVATSDTRETLRYENRKKFIQNAVEIANGRQLIFKLHPNEIVSRAVKEINTYAPGAIIYTSGNVHEMIANCDVLITKFSTVVYTGIALGKEVYSDFPIEKLKKLSPIQNNGTSAKNIAELARKHIYDSTTKRPKQYKTIRSFTPISSKISNIRARFRNNYSN
ncbi:MAG: hypothetical protein N2319_02550 [Candidatus Kapabacteria bacterium]|nr:hypothetical protein [Candidatus Kapabacteria bacterium]